jgi:hypothetical protein
VKIRFAGLVGLLAAVLLLPSVSQAALKAYKSGGLPDKDSVVGNFQDIDQGPVFGTSNNSILRTQTLSPSVTPSANPDFFDVAVDDSGGGIITFRAFEFGGDTNTTTNLTGFSGPSGFIFIRSVVRTTFPQGQTGAGSTTSQIDWGLLTGWTATGGQFCNSSPPFVCTFAAFQEDMTAPGLVRSSTYDIGSWTFDATGDFTSDGYVSGTFDAGLSNTIVFLSGKFFGTTLPALPIVGLGALALGLIVVGGRSLLRGKP